MQQELVNLYQFLYHVTPVIFQVKSWSDSTFCCFVHWELVSTLLKIYPAFYLVIIQRFFNFFVDSGDLWCRANSRNRWKCLNLEKSFFFLEVLKGTAFILQITNDECLKDNATRIAGIERGRDRKRSQG